MHGDSYGGNPLGGLLNNLPLAGAGGKYGGGNECPPNLLTGLPLIAAVTGNASLHGGNAGAGPLGILTPVLGPVLAPVAGSASGGTKYTTGGEGKGAPALPLLGVGLVGVVR